MGVKAQVFLKVCGVGEVLACIWCWAVGEGLEKASTVGMRMEKRNPGLEA